MSAAKRRLQELGISLPQAAAPAANYVPFTTFGGLLLIAGQVCRTPTESIVGVVGADLDFKTAVEGARMCGLNLISQIDQALDGDFDRVERILKLNGYIQAAEGYDELPQVMNGCSDLIVDVFGDKGRHARTTVGVLRLPSGYAVEVDAMVAIRP